MSTVGLAFSATGLAVTLWQLRRSHLEDVQKLVDEVVANAWDDRARSSKQQLLRGKLRGWLHPVRWDPDVRTVARKGASAAEIDIASDGAHERITIALGRRRKVGAALGLVAAKFSPQLAKLVTPGAPVPVLTPLVIAIALACALAVAAATGLPAAWRVKRVSIADALGGR